MYVAAIDRGPAGRGAAIGCALGCVSADHFPLKNAPRHVPILEDELEADTVRKKANLPAMSRPADYSRLVSLVCARAGLKRRNVRGPGGCKPL